MGGINPFVELYVSENIAAEKFVRIFSPILARQSETHALFQPGNIVLTGLQGSGKTALLSLMKPEVMIAYRKSGLDFPLPSHCSRFLSGGINLNSSKARDFGQRMLGAELSTVSVFALLFGDFVNYWIIDDLLNNLEKIANDTETGLGVDFGIHFGEEQLSAFVKVILKNACWFGALSEVGNYSEFRQCVTKRIADYRSFLNYNIDLPNYISASKTSPGEPISVIAESLRTSGIVPEDIPVLIKIDQFEDLLGLENDAEDLNGDEFRGVVMKMLSERDHRVSYRIGTRPYAMFPDFSVFGSSTVAEELRNFKVVDIGELMRGGEARRSLFPRFCEDVFKRRLGSSDPSTTNLLKTVFGARDIPSDRAKNYVKSNPSGVIRSNSGLPVDVIQFLQNLAISDPLSAKLGEAWLLQRQPKSDVSLAIAKLEEWNSNSSQWWKKERIQQALLQIAADQKQRMIWYGQDDIVALAGHNVLTFLTLCQFIWAEYLRTLDVTSDLLPVNIGFQIQNIGIQEASAYWFRKIKSDPKGGDDRHRFINVLAVELRNALRDDRRMSYPGENGFSLPNEIIERHEDAAKFLERCVAYGVLESFKHTPKTKGRGQSRKWYLFAILTPYFQLPTAHIKEPKYLTIDILYRWFTRADVDLNIPAFHIKSRETFDGSTSNQLSLDLDQSDD